MATALPVELYEILEDRLGREQAHDIVKALENAADRISLQKKLELRDELSKELAGKADLLAVKADLQGTINTLKSDLQGEIKALRWEFKLYFAVITAVILLTNPRALDLLTRLLGVVK